MSEGNIVKYDLFICYYSGTGVDFAKFLKLKLKDFGINAFLDVDDMPQSIKQDTDEWRRWIEKAIINSQKFVLLMTLGFNTRNEVLRELKISKDNKIERIHFKHTGIADADLLVKIGDEELDLSKFQYIMFDDEPDLLRKLGAELLGRESTYPKKSIFMETALRIIQNEGSDARIKDKPIIEVVVGSTDEVEKWLPPNVENRNLMYNSPFRFNNVIPRTNFFDCESLTKDFFRVHTIGFFHLITPMLYDEKRNLCGVDTIVYQMLEILIYSIRVMKFRKIQTSQSIYIILINIVNIGMTFDRYFLHKIYHFSSESTEINFISQFNPSDAWSEIRKVFAKIFRDLCTELGVIEITDIDINKRLYRILGNLQLHACSTNGVTISRIDLEDFGFSEEEKNNLTNMEI